MSSRAERYYDDVCVGDEVEGFSVELTWTALALQVSGSQDWSTVHHDPVFASESGHATPFFNTGWTAAMLGRVLSDWAGPYGWLCRLDFSMRRMNALGDTVFGRATVTGKQIAEDGRHLVELDVWLENKREGRTTPARATVRLRSRAQASSETSNNTTGIATDRTGDTR